MSSKNLFFLILIGFVVLPAQALADNLRCPNTGRIIHEGETQGEVVSKCGEPDYVSQTSSLFLRINRFESREIPVEEWTYDFGPNRFMQILRFEGGRLRQIEHSGYGRGR